jgi:hypothetical protein
MTRRFGKMGYGCEVVPGGSWSAAFPRPRDEAVVNRANREAHLSAKK